MPILMIAWGFIKSGAGFLAKLSPATLALIAVTLIGVGVHIADTRHISRLEGHNLALSRSLGKERIAHAADIARWKAASEAATKLNSATIARVATQQAIINKGTTDAYQTQLADLRARFDRVRRAAPNDKRAPNGARASPVPVGPCPAADKAVPSDQPDLLYTAEVELQLNALIDWNRKQSAVNPNAR